MMWGHLPGLLVTGFTVCMSIMCSFDSHSMSSDNNIYGIIEINY